MSRFEGFADDGARVFEALAKNNDRAWFLAHKAELEEGSWRASRSEVARPARTTRSRGCPRASIPIIPAPICSSERG